MMKIKSVQNNLGYRCLPDDIQAQLFGDKFEHVSRVAATRIKANLGTFDIAPADQPEKEINFPNLKALLGDKLPVDILAEATKPYYETKVKVTEFLEGDFQKKQIPSRKDISNNLVEGWVRYGFDGDIRQVDYPMESISVIDTETYVKSDNMPVMAGARTSDAYYVWLHPSLVSRTPFTPILTPIGKDAIVINHNVGFDANKFLESYDLEGSPQYIDTMSMHIAVAGMGNQQRKLYAAPRKFGIWHKHTSPNSLVEAYNFHCQPDQPLGDEDKALRNVFVWGHIEDFKANLLDLIVYCLLDCHYTATLAASLWPKYLYHNPEDITLAGHIIIGKSILPVIPNFRQWINKTNLSYEEKLLSLSKDLKKLAAIQLDEGDTDFWSNQLDWKPASSGANKGKPAWQRKYLLAKNAKPLTPSTILAPLLLKLTWDGKPLYKTKSKGWAYLVDPSTPGCFLEESKNGPIYLKKVPHPKGDRENCGSPLSKDYIPYMERGVLASSSDKAQGFMAIAKSLSYWKSMKSRAEAFHPHHCISTGLPLLKPMTVPHGTVTRRAVEPTWLTCSDIKPTVHGSELKSRVQAPSGYKLVGADFASQELRYGAGLADAKLAIHGSSPMSATQMVGDKDKGTDGHSQLANYVGVSRQLGKTMNFLMLFFGGELGLFEAIKTAKLDTPDAECQAMAKKAIGLRRGQRGANGLYVGGTDSAAYNYMISVAQSQESRTALGKSAISTSLKTANVGKDFMPSRCNRVIQSGCVDILHTFLTLLEYLGGTFQVDFRYCIAIHDEVWTLVKEENVGAMAEIFQMAHLLTWCVVYESLGFESIPFDYLFFPSINVDTVLRKEPNYAEQLIDGEWTYTGTKTVSNPDEVIEKGYEIKPKDMQWNVISGIIE